MRVCVVGGGIAGATTALAVKRRFPHLAMDLVADAFSPETTGDGSAGFWCPHLDPATPEHLVVRWSTATYNLWRDLWNDPAHELSELSAALSMLPATEFWDARYFDQDGSESNPAWADAVINFRTLDAAEVAKYKPGGDPVRSHWRGRSYVTFTLEPSLALPAIYGMLRRSGVGIRRRAVRDLHDDLGDDYDLVINCCGSGARDLVGDDDIVPISGHVLRVKAPWIHTAMTTLVPEGKSCYILPNRDCVILGSVDTVGNWSREPLNPGDKDRIRSKCTELVPSLRHAKFVREWVGLRPMRKTGVRLEYQLMEKPGKKSLKVIHNYGHGGSGVTLSWGCAQEVVRIMASKFPSAPAKL